MLQAPAMSHEVGGQPIEEVRMSWFLAGHAEIGRGADQAASEMMHPDAIDDDPRQQRIIGADEPTGEGEASTGGGQMGIALGKGNRTSGPGKNGESAGGNGIFGLFRIASM